MSRESLYGLMVEFENHDQLLAAVRQARAEGYRRMDAYSPFPVEGLPEALGRHRTWVPLTMLIGGLLGAGGGYYLQYWTLVIDYPLNIAGRPYHSWPMFVPITFELMVLTAAIFGVIGMLAMNGLPRPYHPVFNVPEFGRATSDRFFLSIESTDQKFDLQKSRQFLESMKGRGVYEVER